MISNYQEFLLERQETQLLELITEAVFLLSNDLSDIMEILATSSEYDVKRIASMFIDMDIEDLDTNMSYFDITDNNGLISFLNPEKAEKVKREEGLSSSEVFNKLKGNKVRLGRLIRKVADVYIKHKGMKKDGALYKRYKFTDEEIENFVNAFKSTYDFQKSGTGNFELVSGNDILYAYDESNYFSDKGTLGGSCMRHEECQGYFEMYTENDVELLVLWGPSKKVMGRALVWKLTNGKKFMDRVYYNRDSDLNLFIKYAEENKFLYKEENNSRANTKIMTPDDDYLEAVGMNLEVKVYSLRYSDKDNENFPYMDTFKYYYWREGKLRNWTDSSNYYVELEDTDGFVTCGECSGDGELDCETCDGRGNTECEDCDGYGHTNCEKCDGEGSTDCEKCEATGWIGDDGCTDCHGNGYIDCEECGTSGHIDCEECDSRGYVECGDCEGNAQVECSICGGFSYRW